MAKKVYGECFGCTLNRGEYYSALAQLEERGWDIVCDSEGADLCLIFGCVVIDKTERRVKKRIEDLKMRGGRVVVGGCLAPFYDGEKIYPAFTKCDADGIEFRGVAGSSRIVAGVTGIVPISTGCPLNCSYCATKLARGGLKSYPLDLVVGDVAECVRGGAKEIFLTSQDCGAWGIDSGGTIVDLVERISHLKGDFMVRVGMMNPAFVDGSIIGKVFEQNHIFRFLHVPLQSGSDEVIARMNRLYTVEGFISTVAEYRRRFGDGVLSTDVIVGFPGETAGDFRKTVETVEEIRPDVLNITRFSHRPGTKAYEMDDRIHGRIAKERSRYLTSLAKRIGAEINSRWIGEKVKVLITEKGKEGKEKEWMGRTVNYKPVVLDGEDGGLGKWVKTRICDITSSYLIGERCTSLG